MKIASIKSGWLFAVWCFGLPVKALAQPCDNPPAQVIPCLVSVICNGSLTNNYCGSTDPGLPFVAPRPFCGATNNNQFIAFVVGSTTISIQINVDLAAV